MFALLVVVLIVLLLLGGDRLATLGKGLGEGAKAFRKATHNPRPPARRVELHSVELRRPENEPASPKLLPAKGETSSEAHTPDSERH
ncbi:MAG TPA: twin-arginine translocase TatA/TatE family subunit [Polyangiaceae bacterium]|nr:twin-arginine translocase TatA/TatE family subunit [Polyangiaceae bacterium]